MSATIVVAGTDTDVGKTVFSAALVHALKGVYWKPVATGRPPETDTEIVRRLAELPPERIIPEAFKFATPASPHFAAERDGRTIDAHELEPPRVAANLVIELAGGLAVPLTRDVLQVDVLARWGRPVVLVAATRLGTINHSLLSIEALKSRSIPVVGVAFVGDENADSQRTICEFGRVRQLGRLPMVFPLTGRELHRAFAANFLIADFLKGGVP